jgi:energy-coupling factor transport system permease protein
MIPTISHFFFSTILGRTFIGYLLMFVVPLLLPVVFFRLVGIQGLRHLFSYEPKQSVIHRLDPRLKILYPFVMSIISVFLNWNYVFLLLFFTIIPWLLMRTSRQRLRVVLTMVLTPAIGLVWSQGLFHPDPVNPLAHLIFPFPATISWFGSPGLSSTGLIYGLEQAGRVMVSASASLILLFTTKPSEVIWAFYKFRLPAAVGLAFTAALRFLPQLIERMTLLLQVMQVRGYDLTRPRWWQVQLWPDYIWRVLVSVPIVTVPLLIGSLRATSVMAMVVDARAFGSKPQRSILREHKTTQADILAISALVVLVIVVIILLSLHIGYRQV